jgi:hypothetical protein
MRALRHKARRKAAWPLAGGELVERFLAGCRSR